MTIPFTRKQLLEQMEDAAREIRTFYEQPFTNYAGSTPDTGEPYADIVAGWCADNWSLFENIPTLTPDLPYRSELRDGTRPRRLSRAEQILSRDLYIRHHPGTGSQLNIIGQILDYQMPLGSRPRDRAGTVDLVAWDGETLRLLRLRSQGSTDSMVRCLLESYTHLQTVNRGKLLADLHLPPDADVAAAPFVYRDGHQKADLSRHPASMHRLIRLSGCRPIYYIP